MSEFVPVVFLSAFVMTERGSTCSKGPHSRDTDVISHSSASSICKEGGRRPEKGIGVKAEVAKVRRVSDQ